MNLNQTLVDIQNCDRAELDQVISAVKLRQTLLARTAARSFVRGDQVKFSSRQGGVMRGEVVKVNPKTVVVDCGTQRWKVTASMLSSA
jgi:hypothetical protein